MSTRYTDEEKALLQAYHDEELGNHDQLPPLLSDEQVDDSVRRKLCRKKKFRVIFKHLALFSLLFLGWQTYRAYRAGKLTCGHWRNDDKGKSNMWLSSILDEHPQHPPQGFPWPPQVTVEECVEWPAPSPPDHDHGRHHGHHDDPHHPPHSFEYSFSLPSSADILAFFARGPYSVGHFNVEQGTEETDEVKVDVTTKWHGQRHVLDLVQLCKFTGEKGLIGVGIVSVKADRHHHRHHRNHRGISFEVNVRLPASSDRQLEIKKFLTYLPVFSQTVGNLGNSVFFDGIGLKGSVASIKVDSLSAKNTYVNAGVGAIKGNFSTSSSLELITSSGEIDVDVNLINDETADEWTNLVLSASTGYARRFRFFLSFILPKIISAIKANLSLHTDSDSNVGGKFNITSGVSAGAITLNTVVAPKDSTVDLTAHSSIGAIDVTMHETFEGKFDLASSVFSPPTVENRKEKDEDGRERKIEYGQVGRGAVHGNVWWDAGEGNTDGKERGNVDMKNSLGTVVLKV
ncbi:hypothetical protein L218DRAFT_998472 [Marasmius fiardii PR-910]|nr:hypothetical protein L218DRAFT_998472 [Marasmius fiardii PR-910]